MPHTIFPSTESEIPTQAEQTAFEGRRVQQRKWIYLLPSNAVDFVFLLEWWDALSVYLWSWTTSFLMCLLNWMFRDNFLWSFENSRPAELARTLRVSTRNTLISIIGELKRKKSIGLACCQRCPHSLVLSLQPTAFQSFCCYFISRPLYNLLVCGLLVLLSVF